MNIKEQILLHVSANEDEIDELLDDRSLMNLLTGICGKHKANLPIYNGIGKTRVLPSFSCFYIPLLPARSQEQQGREDTAEDGIWECNEYRRDQGI
jgi:hypothetical protein